MAQICGVCGFTEEWITFYSHRRCPSCTRSYPTLDYLSKLQQEVLLERTPSVKTFFLWLTIQCVFARVMIGMTLGLWSGLHIAPDYLGYFVAPATLICLVEAITSAMVVFPLVTGNVRK